MHKQYQNLSLQKINSYASWVEHKMNFWENACFFRTEKLICQEQKGLNHSARTESTAHGNKYYEQKMPKYST